MTVDVVRLTRHVVWVDRGPTLDVTHTVRGETRMFTRAEHHRLLDYAGFRDLRAEDRPWRDAGFLVRPFEDEPGHHGGLRPGTEAQLHHDYMRWYWAHEVDAERGFKWLGYHVLKMPPDLFAYQTLMVQRHIREVLEIGSGNGGGLAFFASILALTGGGRVVGVERDPTAEPLPALPGVVIEVITEDAHTDAASRHARATADGFGLVVIDADPTSAGKAALLDRWSSCVRVGGLAAVEDVDGADDPVGLRNALDSFLLKHVDFAMCHVGVPLLKGIVLQRG